MRLTFRFSLLLLFTFFISCKSKDAEPDAAQTVYVANRWGNLYAFDAETGAKKWEGKTVAHPSSAPTVANGVVYIGGDKLYAFDAATGDPKWEKALGTVDQIPFVNSVPTVANGLVYVVVGNYVNKLFALDANTGAVKWEVATGGSDNVSPTVANGLVYTGIAGKLFAVDALTGEKKWEVTGLWGRPYNPSVVNGIIYTNCGTKLYAHDALTGQQKWVSDAGGIGSTTIVGELIYFLGGSGVYVINAASGKYLREYRFCTDNNSYPLVANGLIYAGGGDCYQTGPTFTFYALDATTGTPKWTQQFNYSTSASPTLATGTVFIGTSGTASKMYALEAQSGAIKWEASLSPNENMASPACVLTRQGKVYYAVNSGDQQ